MPVTNFKGRQILDGTIQRADLDVSTVGSAVISKLVQGTGVSLSSTGGDAGTGDVTVNLGTWYTNATASTLLGRYAGTNGAVQSITIGSGLNLDTSTGVLSSTATGGTTPYAEVPTGTINGSNTSFTLANTPTASAGVMVFLDGIVQYNGSDYTVSGSTITFTTAPASGSTIFAYYGVVAGSPSTPTLQQVLTQGSTLSGSNTIGIPTATDAFSILQGDNTLAADAAYFKLLNNNAYVFGQVTATAFSRLQVNANAATLWSQPTSTTQYIIGASTVLGYTYMQSATSSGSTSMEIRITPTAATIIKDGGTGYNIVTTNSTDTLSNKRFTTRINSSTSAASVTPDVSAYDMYAFTALAAALTFNNPTGTPIDGDQLMFRIKDNGTARAFTWSGTQYRASSDLALPTTTTINKTMYLGFQYNAADTKWDLIAKLDNF